MAEPHDRNRPDEGGWQNRLRVHAGVLIATALVFALFSVSGAVAPLVAGLGLLLIVLVALLTPGHLPSPFSAAAALDSDALVDRSLAAFADAVTDACFLLDWRGVVVYANGAARQQFATTRIGDPLSLSLRSPPFVAAVQTALATEIAQSAELQWGVFNPTWYRVLASPLAPDPDRPPSLLVVSLHSLTEQKRVEAMRADFIANVSHELRTPLTSLLGFIDTLVGPAANDTAARERFLSLMRGQAQRMSKLIDDLLSLSRIELRQHVRPTGIVDLASLLHEVAEGLQPAASAAEVEVRIAADGPANVQGDREELYEVVENLLANAIKYGASARGIDLALAPAVQPGFAWHLSVTDYGPGVAAHHVPRLTERFYRVDAEPGRKRKGTGLGLAIVKHIVQRHHGDLAIHSAEGEGTRVDVWLRR